MATRKNLKINKKRAVEHFPGHGYIKGYSAAFDPRPGGVDRQDVKRYEEIKKKLDKDFSSVEPYKVVAAHQAASEAKDRIEKRKNESAKAFIKKQADKDEAEEKARQKKLAAEAKKKPKPASKKKKEASKKKKEAPKRKRKGVSINRRKARK